VFNLCFFQGIVSISNGGRVTEGMITTEIVKAMTFVV